MLTQNSLKGGDNYPDMGGEEGPCQFSLMALLRAESPDEIQSAVDDELDALCQALESENADFQLSEAPELAGLAERESTITVATLALYVKINLDAVSLSHGDLDVGV